jgi:hypothetical protein
MISEAKSNPISKTPLEFVVLLIPFAATFSLALCCLSIAAIVSLATTGALFGWLVAGSIPLWASILIWMTACVI